MHVRSLLVGRCAGERLPPLARMAREAGVSLVTMHRAVGELGRDGVLHVVPGGGVFVRVADPRMIDISPHGYPRVRERGYACQRIAETIERDLLAGGLSAADPLPSLKELSRRYGVSYPTIRKALRLLAERGRLEPHGRGYRLALAPKRSRGMTTVVVIAATDNMDMLIGATPRSEALWRSLEQTCQRRGLRLEVISLAKAIGDEAYPDGRRYTLVQRCGRYPVLGFVVMRFGWPLDRLARELVRSGRPSCILDEVGGDNIGDGCMEPAICYVPVGCDRRPGREMGQYLASLGHRQVVLFGDSESSHIYARRAEGLRQGLGPDGAVHRLTTEIAAGARIGWGQPRGHSEASHLVEGLRSFVDGLHAMVDTYACYSLLRSASELASDHLAAGPLEPVFEHALSLGEVTAWVGFNDRIALMAHQFLRGRGVRIPRSMTVVGFDDTLTALGNGLTSHNPNMAGVVDAAVTYLFDCGHGGKRRPLSPLCVPGVVIERRSSGKARRGPLFRA